MTRSGEFHTKAALRPFWYVVATEDDVRNRPVARTVLGEHIVIFRGADGRPAALPDMCPHRNAPLSDGNVADGKITCPYHGWSFDATGRCVRVPSAVDGARIPSRATLAPYRVAVRYGLVWVALDEPVASIPACSFDGDPAYRRLNGPMLRWSASATRIVDNFLDISHVPWLHQGTFGSTAAQQVPVFELGDVGDGFLGYAFGMPAANAPLTQATGGQAGAVARRTMTIGFLLPFVIRITSRHDDGLEHILYLLSTPIDDVNTYLTFVVWRKDDFVAPAEEVLALDLAIAAEDKAVLERIPGPLPLDSAGTVSVQSDRASVAWRRRFAALLAGVPIHPDREELNGVRYRSIGPGPASVDACGPAGRQR